jgi:glycosyltransferase involved in cell wall biosynthesis
MTDALGQSQVIPYLSGLARSGFKIHVISFEKPIVFETGRKEVENIFSSNGIGWTYLWFSSSPFSKLSDIYRIRKTALKLHKNHNFSIVHCRSYVASIAGLSLKRKKNVAFVFDMRGFWADERIEGGIWNLSNPFMKLIYKYFKKLEISFFNEADAVISLTHTGKAIIGQQFGKAVEQKTTVIPCCVDSELFSPLKLTAGYKKDLKRQLGIPENNFILSYLGNTGTWYMTPEMLQFFARLLKKKPDSVFLFITLENPESIHKLALQAGIPEHNIRIEKASRQQVPELLGISDLSVFFIKPVFSKKASSPTKQAEIMSMGIPFISNSGIGDILDIVTNSRVGYLIDDFSNDSYDKAIEQIPFLLASDADKIRQCAIGNFNLETGINSYCRVYNDLNHA